MGCRDRGRVAGTKYLYKWVGLYTVLVVKLCIIVPVEWHQCTKGPGSTDMVFCAYQCCGGSEMAGIADTASLKSAVFAEVRKVCKEHAAQSDQELNRLFFQLPNSLRLSLTGFRVIKSIFTAYSFPIPADIKSRQRGALSKLEYPYFFTAKRLIVFSEMDASMITLCGGVSQFLESCSKFDS